MFKIAVKPRFKATVTLDLQGGDGGTFEAEFERLTQTELDTLSEQIKRGEMTDAAIVNRVLSGWSGLVDGDGTAFEYSPGNRERLLDIAGTRGAIVRAFFDSFPQARAKN